MVSMYCRAHDGARELPPEQKTRTLFNPSNMTYYSFKGHTVVITGAGGGLGKAYVLVSPRLGFPQMIVAGIRCSSLLVVPTL